MSTRRWILAAAVALGGAGVWLWSQTRSPAARAHEVARAMPPTRPRAVTPWVAERPAFASVPELRAAAEPAPDAFADEGTRLRARFDREPTDTSWAGDTRAQLETELGRFSGNDATVRSVDCRTSLCRVEVAVASNDAGATFVQSWLRDRTFDGPGYVTQADGKMVMFLGRTGTELLTP
jgi:hypothetical protein